MQAKPNSEFETTAFWVKPLRQTRSGCRQFHDLDVARLGLSENSFLLASCEDKHPMRKAKHLLEIRADDDDSHTISSESGDRFVDGGSRPHVYTSSGFIKNEDLGRAADPSCDDRFLLIAAGKKTG